MRAASVVNESGGPYGEMMARYLGPVILAAFRDAEVTEFSLNPGEGAVRFDARSGGGVERGAHLERPRVEMFLNAVAASLGLTLGAEQPRLEAELPALGFRGSRLQGFVPPVTPAPAFAIRKPPALVYSLADYVAACGLSRAPLAAFLL